MMGTRSPAFETLADMAAWCERAPAGTHLDAHAVADLLNSAVDSETAEPPPKPAALQTHGRGASGSGRSQPRRGSGSLR